MKKIIINDKISYIECVEEPVLSADIGIVKDGDSTWVFDVGADKEALQYDPEGCNIVISHFHQDHMGNINDVKEGQLFVSKESFRHAGRGTVVTEDMNFGKIHIFPIPSSHAKGCLGMEIDGEYAFVGDSLYCRVKDGFLVYNAQKLKEEIDLLKSLKAKYLLVSHARGMISDKCEEIKRLEHIYALRTKNNPEIWVKR